MGAQTGQGVVRQPPSYTAAMGFRQQALVMDEEMPALVIPCLQWRQRRQCVVERRRRQRARHGVDLEVAYGLATLQRQEGAALRQDGLHNSPLFPQLGRVCGMLDGHAHGDVLGCGWNEGHIAG